MFAWTKIILLAFVIVEANDDAKSSKEGSKVWTFFATVKIHKTTQTFILDTKEKLKATTELIARPP